MLSSTLLEALYVMKWTQQTCGIYYEMFNTETTDVMAV